LREFPFCSLVPWVQSPVGIEKLGILDINQEELVVESDECWGSARRKAAFPIQDRGTDPGLVDIVEHIMNHISGLSDDDCMEHTQKSSHYWDSFVGERESGSEGVVVSNGIVKSIRWVVPKTP
jgi:hypothetical protein